MNWDWEKLQEKRQRQPNANKPQQQGNTPPPKFPDFGEKFKNFKPSSFRGWKVLGLAAIALWAASGFFIVGPDEVGVIQRFGQYNRTVGEGPHIRLPYPIESHLKPNITQWQRLEIGFRGAAGGQTRLVPVEASMLTSDENVVMVQFVVQYRIGQKEDNARKFLFNLTGQHETVKSAAEAAMREVIGKSKIDAALTEGKAEIQLATKTLLQNILDAYDAGVEIGTLQMQDVHAPQEVMTAFRDVASAREDKIRSTNEAEKYRNEFIPEAQGIAARILNEAEAYKENVVRKAQGETQRFLAVVTEYNKAKDITKKRMYLEAMEAILSAPGMEKIIMPKDTGERTLPLLPLGSTAIGAGGKK